MMNMVFGVFTPKELLVEFCEVVNLCVSIWFYPQNNYFWNFLFVIYTILHSYITINMKAYFLYNLYGDYIYTHINKRRYFSF
jgi:hypothetical protein